MEGYSRAQLVVASAASGLPGPIDGVTSSIDEDETIVNETPHASKIGFTGKLCLHPRQVELINRALSPGREIVEWVQIIIISPGAGGSVAVIDGKVICCPVIDRARKTIKFAEDHDG